MPFLLTSFPGQPLICFLLLWISFTYLGISGKMGPTIYSLLCVPAFVQCNDFENYPWVTCISRLFLFIAEWNCLNQQFAYSFTWQSCWSWWRSVQFWAIIKTAVKFLGNLSASHCACIFLIKSLLCVWGGWWLKCGISCQSCW